MEEGGRRRATRDSSLRRPGPDVAGFEEEEWSYEPRNWWLLEAAESKEMLVEL